jgi:hypothetical protein
MYSLLLEKEVHFLSESPPIVEAEHCLTESVMLTWDALMIAI